jgi:hypothetical protein
MKSAIQYAFARNWPLRAYLSVWAIAGVMFAVGGCQPTLRLFSDWRYCLLFTLSVLIAPLLFVFLSLPLAFLILGPVYSLGERLAGAPFRVGDRVRILVGPHRDRVVDVYAVWAERHEVRVRLDAEAEQNYDDVLSNTMVCRDEQA